MKFVLLVWIEWLWVTWPSQKRLEEEIDMRKSTYIQCLRGHRDRESEIREKANRILFCKKPGRVSYIKELRQKEKLSGERKATSAEHQRHAFSCGSKCKEKCKAGLCLEECRETHRAVPCPGESRGTRRVDPCPGDCTERCTAGTCPGGCMEKCKVVRCPFWQISVRSLSERCSCVRRVKMLTVAIDL